MKMTAKDAPKKRKVRPRNFGDILPNFWVSQDVILRTQIRRLRDEFGQSVETETGKRSQ